MYSFSLPYGYFYFLMRGGLWVGNKNKTKKNKDDLTVVMSIFKFNELGFMVLQMCNFFFQSYKITSLLS